LLWRDRLVAPHALARQTVATPAPVNTQIHGGAPCRASACGATQCFGRATRTGATKGAMAYKFFSTRIIIEIFIKKD